MNGLINLHKPPGITSAQALYRLRRITRVRKSGHAGTLDPAAQGVLVICLGRATRLVETLMDQPKLYQATARLDVTSASFDQQRPLVPVAVQVPPDHGRLRQALLSFQGRLDQVPPAVSALKVAGRPAYELERRGYPPRLRARTVRIYWLRLLRYRWPLVRFELACGRGTYVRALIRDLGQRLHTGGCLTSLTRLAVGPFRLDQAWTLERLERAAGPDEYLIPLEHARELLCRPAQRLKPRTAQHTRPDRHPPP